MNKTLLACLVSLSFSAQAAVSLISESGNYITLKVNERYVLGDNDTLTSAKELTLEQAKKAASDYGGTYVESELQVSNAKITKQQVRVLTAGFLEVLSRKDKRYIDKNGSVVLDTEAKIKLSKEAIKDGLAKLKSDPERKAKMDALEQDNQRLRNDVLELTRKINEGARTDLLAEREAVLVKLDSNRAATKKSFEQGTLFQLAMLDGQDYDLAKQAIDRDVFGYFKNQTKITLGNPTFKKNPNHTYDIYVPVSWNVAMKPVREVLSKYLKIKDKDKYHPPYTLALPRYSSSGEDQTKPYSSELLNYITNHTVALEIEVAGKVGYLPISGETHFFAGSNFAFQFSNDSKNNDMLEAYGRSRSSGYRNPVAVKGITEAELKSMTALNSRIVVVPNEQLARWEYD
ncbi:hypothetical protein G6Z92_06460 [Vibrio aestuarianus subsp. cardii]|uniref:hypothetical protein n=1 Tax=Vibrio aestuarianus TaxID=28171 RepID=UPI0015C55C4A|nr:hypothetical protein [Vibrio aestuarianus]NGZ66628.1 hypothetical protein [Vibrio aestuarianus subsp. cardii]